MQEARPAPDRDPGVEAGRGATRWGWIGLAAGLAPSLLAIALVPDFVTQDGPAHVYNAHILLNARDPTSPLAAAFEVRWRPLPNWAGHLGLAGLMTIVPARIADRLMMALTLVGPAAGLAWLRRRVVGPEGTTLGALWAVLLGLNITWLLGFYSFLLGAALVPITLGVWWAGRHGLTWRRAAGLAALLVLGYFCHPISLGLTVVGLAVLALATPGVDRRRLARTALAAAPLVGLGLAYAALMRGAGAIEPVWGVLKRPWSAGLWLEQWEWVDPLTIGRRTALPFVPRRARGFVLLAPTTLAMFALLGLATATALRPPAGWRERRGWAVLAGLLLVGGVVAPDTLGPKHGNYLPQRVLLLGLMAALPALDLDLRRPSARAAGSAVAVALALQSGFVVEYARHSDRVVGPLLRAGRGLGTNRRVGTLLLDLRVPFRSNPLMHADCLLGVGTGNVLWTDYEAAHYYFPVGFRAGVVHPPPLDFEAISIQDDPADAPERARRLEALLAEHHPEIDALLIRGSDPDLDALVARWYDPSPVGAEGPARVLLRRDLRRPGA